MSKLGLFYGGAKFSPPDHRDYLYMGAHPMAVNPNTDLRTLATEIRNQGREGSCTAFSSTDALEYAWRKALVDAGKPVNIPERLSGALQYYNTRKFEDNSFPGDNGCSMRGAAKALADYGDCYESLWPYDISGASVNNLPPAAAVAAAGKHKLVTYLRVAGTGTALLNGMLSALNDGFCVWIAFNVYDSFERVGADGRIPMRLSTDTVLGGHAVTLWGSTADASFGGGGQFYLKNQWTEQWANGGWANMPWGYVLDNTVVEAWVFKAAVWGDDPTPPPPPPPPPTPGDWRPYVIDASKQVKIVRADPASFWPEGTLEKADMDLDTALGIVPPPPPPPPVVTVAKGVAVTYSGHDPARDVYLGYDDNQVQWGPHHGFPLIAPADGTVELYTFPTPLAAGMLADPHYMQRHNDLFKDWVCMADPGKFGAQNMYVAVFWPNTAISTSKGTCVGLGYGHIHGVVKTGAVKKGEQFGKTWDSGIHFEPGVPNARAAHCHAIAFKSRSLSMNGDIDGMACAEAMGWKVSFIGTGPGPNDYMGGRYCAGRLLTDFSRGSHPIPPTPS